MYFSSIHILSIVTANAQRMQVITNHFAKINLSIQLIGLLSFLIATISLTYWLFAKYLINIEKTYIKGHSIGFNSIEETRIYFLILAIIFPFTEIFIEYFKVRKESDMFANIILGLISLAIYFFTRKDSVIRKYTYKIFVSFYLIFSGYIIYKSIFLPFELITFGEFYITIFFSFGVLKSIHHFYLFNAIVFIIFSSLFFTSLLPVNLILIYLNGILVISTFSYVRNLAILKSQEKLIFSDKIVNSGDSLIIATNRLGYLEFCSENVLKILGYSSNEVLGNNFWELTEDKDYQKIDYSIKYIEEQSYIRKLKCKNGDYKFIQWTDKKHSDDLYVGIGLDVSELVNVKEQYKNLVQSATDIIYESDKYGNFIFFNNVLTEITGYEINDLIGKHFTTVIAEDYRMKISQFYLESIDSKTNYEAIEFPIVAKNKSLIWVSQTVNVLRNEAGKIIKYAAIVRDISIAKNLEFKNSIKNEKRFRYNQITTYLTANPESLNIAFTDKLKHILSTSAINLNIDRIGVWNYFDNKIINLKSYVRSTEEFIEGDILYQADVPEYFAEITKGIIINAPDIALNDATKDLLLDKNNDIKSLLDVPIFINANLSGVLSCEMTKDYKTWDNEDLNFVRSIADIIAVAQETERRLNAEKAIFESESNFRLINETISDVFWLYDLVDEKIIYISPSSKNILGIDPSEFYDSNIYWQNYILDEDKKHISEAHKLIEKEGYYDIEYRVNVNGEVKWIHEKSYGIKNENNVYVKSSGICADITEKKNKEIELKLLSIVAEKTSNGILISDKEGKAIWANQSYQDILEISLDKLIGNRPRDLFNKEDTLFLETIEKQNGTIFTSEFKVATSMNNIKWLEVKNTPVYDNEGNVVQQIEVVTDISEKIKAQQTLLKYSNELEYKVELQKKIINSQSYEELAIETLALIKQQTNGCCKIALLSVNPKNTLLSGHYLINNELTKVKFNTHETKSFETIKNGNIFIEKNLNNISEKSVSDLNDLKDGVVSYIILPILSNSKLMGSLNIYLNSVFLLSESEINNLQSFAVLLSAALQQIALQNEIKTKNTDTTDSLNYAKNIQNTILPQLSEMNGTFKDVSMYYKPKDIVSGDFYWAREFDGISYFAVADCTGHGVPGAFLTLIGSRILEQIIETEKLVDPAQILTCLDDQIYTSLNKSDKAIIRDGMEIALCVVDTNNKKIKFSGAGLGLIYFDNDEEVYIKGQRKSIGDYREDEFIFETSEINYRGNEVFYMASDGYQDQLGGENYKRFSKKRTIDLLRKIAPLNAVERALILDSEIKNFIGNHPQTDDITIATFTLN